MLKKFWPAIVWAIGVFVLTAVPGNYIPISITFLDWASPDKIVHFILFGGQSFLILFVIREQYFSGNRRFVFASVAIGLGIIYGLITEVLQYYVFVGRDGNLFDFIADVIGAFMGFLAFYLLFRKKIVHNKVIKN